jgi:rSAM/selenodomain-associated transferase 2
METVTAPAAVVKNELRTQPQALALTVVVPALNAERTLSGCLAAIGSVRAVIVVDGGSSDATTDIARQAGATVIEAPRGRGGQIAAGIKAAEPGWVLVLHADTRLDVGWRDAARVHMANGGALAACFRFALDSDDPRARRLERAVAWRNRVLELPYGDQGLLIHTGLLDRIGGMRPLPLMEDVDIVRRIGRKRLVLLTPRAITSARKWEQEGWIRRSARNLLCLTLWFAGVPPKLIVRLY